MFATMTNKARNHMKIILLLLAIIPVLGFYFSGSPGIIRPVNLIWCEVNHRLLVISENPGRIIQLDPETLTPVKEVDLPFNPSGAVLNRAGDRLFLTSNGANGRILEMNAHTLQIINQFSSGGHTPVSPVLSPDEQSLYLSNRFNNEVVQVDIQKGKIIKRYTLIREPVSLVLSKDGRYLFAANFLPAGPSNAERVNSVISVIDLQQQNAINIDLPNGSNSIGGMTLSPDGRYIYLSHILARYQVPTTQIERGWINTNALSIIDVEKKELLASVLLDDIDLGFTNPRAIHVTPDGTSLIVTSFGGNELSLINRQLLHELVINAEDQNNTPAYSNYGLANDLSVMHRVNRRRIKLPGYGPNSLVVADNTVYISEYYSGTLAIVNLNNTNPGKIQQIVFGREDPFKDMNRYGEMLFNSADLCFQQWQSCASCHPDGRVDGLNWDLLNDGMGNPKNTKSMLYAHETPPSMSLGVRSTAEGAVRAGIRFIQFAEVDEEKAKAIDAYLKSLRQVPSPYLVNNKLSKSARHGQKIFEREGCIACHTPPLYNDLKSYRLNYSGSEMDKGKKLDNSTLVEVWRTAPYLHDGSAKTMEELIRMHNPKGSDSLTEKERADLAEFVLSL